MARAEADLNLGSRKHMWVSKVGGWGPTLNIISCFATFISRELDYKWGRLDLNEHLHVMPALQVVS